jgi:L-ascorbate metabolism protein UlaG (beta-lactamase superfamily)
VIKPLLQGDLLLADIKAARADTSRFHLWWLGQSGFLVQWQGQHLLFDPYLSDSLTTKYAQTDKPHTRMTELVIAPERLDFIDVATSTHNHTDHLDGETLGPLLRVNPFLQLVVPEANREFVAQRLGIPPTQPLGLDAGQSVEVAGFRFHAVPAAHEALDRDRHGRHIYLGYVVQFGEWTIYHSGDTVRYDGMAEILRQWPIDVALLPINGRGPERRVAGNLWGREAAALARDIGARVVIPCHYEMFAFNTATADEFIASCSDLGQSFQVLKAGQRWSPDLEPTV